MSSMSHVSLIKNDEIYAEKLASPSKMRARKEKKKREAEQKNCKAFYKHSNVKIYPF